MPDAAAIVATWRRRFAGLRTNPPGIAAVVAVLAALTPIVVTVVRTALHRWVPVGDNGLLLLRSADVGTANHPWLGTWTSASLTAGTDFNNPGPLLFDVLALPVKWFGYGIGMPIGLGILNGAAVVGAALVARRQGGVWAVVPTMAAAAGIAWSMGSELLVDPWQPHAMMLPFLLLLVLLWGVACGDLILIAWFAGIASLLVQTHVSYSFLVVFFTIAVVAGTVFHLRRTPERRRLVKPVVVSTVVAMAVLWLQPLIEQFFGDGEGNLSRLLANSSSDQPKIGLALGTRLIAGVVVLPPWIARWNFVDAIPSTPYTGAEGARQLVVDGITSGPVAVIAVVVYLAVTAALLWWALRNRRRVIAVALGMVIGLLACAAVSMLLMPTGVLGLSPHQMRWLWPIAAFNLAAIVSAMVLVAADVLARRGSAASGRVVRSAVAFGAVLAVVFAIAGSPTFAQDAGPTADREARESIVSLIDQMSVLAGSGPLEFDDSNLRFAEPYSGAVLGRLGELDVDFEVANPGLVRQVGDGRAISGEAEGRLFLLEGQAAADGAPGADRVAFVPGLDPDEQTERDQQTDAWTLRLTDGLVTLTPAGEAALASGELGLTRAQIDGLDEPRAVVESGLLGNAVDHDWLDVTADEREQLVRLHDLQTRWRFLTVGLFLAPIS